jgi:ABC-type branched-subunit amino acid transport system substrate-binding protein
MRDNIVNKKLLSGLALAWIAATSVHAQDIVIGQSVALSGPNADIGRDMRDGALAVFAHANANNLLGAGRKIQLVTLDNANSRQRAVENTQQLLGQYGALALFGYNSATNSLDALPLVAQAETLFFAPFSGSDSLRSNPQVFTIRASYQDEARKIIEAKRGVGADKAVVLYYDDEVGHSNFDAVSTAFAALGAPKPAGVAVKRGMRLDGATVTALMKDSPHYVLVTTQFGTVSDLLRAASQTGTPMSIAALSFVNPDELSESAGDLARGTVVSQIVPSPRISNQVSIPVVKDCAELLLAFSSAKLNYTSLESCIAAKTLVIALKRAGPKPTRGAILHAMGSLSRVDLGGYSLNFSPTNHNGSTWVELTILARGNRYLQ